LFDAVYAVFGSSLMLPLRYAMIFFFFFAFLPPLIAVTPPDPMLSLRCFRYFAMLIRLFNVHVIPSADIIIHAFAWPGHDIAQPRLFLRQPASAEPPQAALPFIRSLRHCFEATAAASHVPPRCRLCQPHDFAMRRAPASQPAALLRQNSTPQPQPR